MRRIIFTLAAMLVALPAAPAVAGATGTSGPFCGIFWGSLPKAEPTMTSSAVTGLRAGRHPCFDRLVVDLGPSVTGVAGPGRAGYSVEYVPEVRADGSGLPVPVEGGAFLDVTVRAPAVDMAGNPTFLPPDRDRAVAVSGFDTFRQVAYVVTFEGQTQFAVGVRARLPFRVFTLDGPGEGSRLVLDVAHRW